MAEETGPEVVVRPPSADTPQRGKDEVDYGWGGAQDDPGADAEAEFKRRHAEDRPPHHDSDWG